MLSINVTPDDFVFSDGVLFTSHTVSQAFTQYMMAAFLFGLFMGVVIVQFSYSFDEFAHEHLIPWLSKKLNN